jgi:hypothetical protein
MATRAVEADPEDLARAGRLLAVVDNFILHRISPTTFAPDVTGREKRMYVRSGEKGAKEVKAYGEPDLTNVPNDIGMLIRAGIAYRCRIGNAKFTYGTTAEAAVRKALAQEGIEVDEGT